MRALFVLVALAGLAAAAQMCLSGEAALVPGAGAPREPWCNSDDCTLRWSLSFDSATVGAQRWPLHASINGTALTTLWPALGDVGIQCSTSGELIATTATASGGQRLRLVWTYAGVSSFSCTYMLGAIDTASDFRNFQALLAYSGHIASFDATLSTQAPEFSLAGTAVVCDAPPPVPGAQPTPSSPPTCVIGGCRYTPAQWRAHKTSPVWQAVTGRQFCSISYADIIFSRNQAKFMPVHWMREAQLLVAADMDAALYGCALPTDTNAALAVSYAYISNPLNCALNVDRADVVSALADWTDGAAACTQDASDASSGGHVHHAGTSKEQSYLIWAVVMTVVVGVMCILIVALLILFARPLLAFVTGGRGEAPEPVGARIGFWSRMWGDDDDENDTSIGSELTTMPREPALLAGSPMVVMQPRAAQPSSAMPPATYATPFYYS